MVFSPHICRRIIRTLNPYTQHTKLDTPQNFFYLLCIKLFDILSFIRNFPKANLKLKQEQTNLKLEQKTKNKNNLKLEQEINNLEFEQETKLQMTALNLQFC
ncbi:hypothetical protein Glove_682g19 [Diversispora epigaea]|uniref:Uncharacterized protein n=1 Tax=Diversispora epigaea TaxID=1348612 RepID=A0A397G2I6_9GLOM|nr:hypothetical protein Glove_682g19 [Diversispora epigaea]